MLTLFTTAKPFKGHSGIIQRNALRSWTGLHPDVEVILFGDDEGAGEVARKLGIRHEPRVERTEFGAYRIDSMFARAQEIARHDFLCYVNCDIILLQDFAEAMQRVKAGRSHFLAIGRRWDTDIDAPIDFSGANREEEIRKKAALSERRQSEWYIDYFAFSRGLFGKTIPAFGVGRIGWDNWMVWQACQSGFPVIDLSPVVKAIHQNHDYGHHPQGKAGVYSGPEAEQNLQLAGGWGHFRNIRDATHVLGRRRLRRNAGRHLNAAQRAVTRARRAITYEVWLPVWHFVLGISRPLRRALGLRGDSGRSRGKVT